VSVLSRFVDRGQSERLGSDRIVGGDRRHHARIDDTDQETRQWKVG
jgi:hypothetical protein